MFESKTYVKSFVIIALAVFVKKLLSLHVGINHTKFKVMKLYTFSSLKSEIQPSSESDISRFPPESGSHTPPSPHSADSTNVRDPTRRLLREKEIIMTEEKITNMTALMSLTVGSIIFVFNHGLNV